MILYWTVILIIVLDFVWNRTLSLLNLKASKWPVPAEVADVYNPFSYRKQQLYRRACMNFGWTDATLNFLLTLCMFALGGYAWLDRVVSAWSANPTVVSLCFFGVLYMALEILSLPLDWYGTFVIEERFGFNKTTPRTFVLDKLKGWGVTLLIGGVLLGAIISIYHLMPQWFWLLAWGVVTLFSLVMSLFYSQLIVPLFNKQTPLPAGELRDALEAFARKVDFQLTDIYVIDSSKRSTKANAYFTGWGRKKRIVIYDTLISQLTTEEIVAVLAHEVGHYKRHHTLLGFVQGSVVNLLMFSLLGWMLGSDEVARAAGCEAASFHVNMTAFGMLYAPVNMLLEMLSGILSRRHEFEADRFAADNGLARPLASGLKKIAGQALSNLTPHPLCVFTSYSHPTLAQRIRALNLNN